MRVTVVCGDKYHPAEVVQHGLATLNDIGVEWDFVLDTSLWSQDHFVNSDVILLSKGNSQSVEDMNPWLTDAVQAAFVEYVSRGGGLLVVHSGTVGYRNEPVFRSLIGGGFAHHPEQCPVTMQFTAQPETFSKMAPFTVTDEHYLMETYGDDHITFMTSTSIHGTQPAGWIRTQGAGKVCVITPGHNLEVWLHPEFQRTLVNALLIYRH